MRDKIKFAILGCGHIGKRHAEMVLRNPEAELVALIDTRPKKEVNIDNFEVPYFDSLEKFLSSEIECDVVNITTPNGLHKAQAIAILDKKKHIVVEKPLTLTKADAEKIIFKALQVQRQVFVVMQNRYSAPSIWLKELLVSEKLGKIFMVQINCFWNRDERYYVPNSWHGTKELDGGTLFTQFSHFIDLLYWCFGDITNISAKLRDFNHQNLTEFEDSGFVNFDFLEGGIGSINYSTSVWDKNLESSITIIAEKGSVKVGGQYMNEIEYCHIKDYKMPELVEKNADNQFGNYKGAALNHHYIIENVVNVLKGRDSITTNALEGLKVVEIIERIYNV